jgi:hypothetical protein
MRGHQQIEKAGTERSERSGRSGREPSRSFHVTHAAALVSFATGGTGDLWRDQRQIQARAEKL